MATFSENFNGYSNGTLTGQGSWATAGSTSDPVVASGVATSDPADPGGDSADFKSHGLTFSGSVFQIDFDAEWHSVSGEGVGVAVIKTSDSSGWGIFCSNNMHIQEFVAGGTHNNLTNDGWPSGGGVLESHHIKFTCDGTTVIGYSDGTLVSSIAKTTTTPGDLVFIQLESVTGSYVAKMDNIVIQTFIGAGFTPAPPRQIRQAIPRASYF